MRAEALGDNRAAIISMRMLVGRFRRRRGGFRVVVETIDRAGDHPLRPWYLRGL